MNLILKTIEVAVLALTLLFLSSVTSLGFELTTNYTSITYSSKAHLREFNNSIYLGKYNYLLRNKNIVTINDEVKTKVDLLVEKVKNILEMYPENLKFRVTLCGTENDVRKAYRVIYGKEADYSAFYTIKGDTVYFSANDVELLVLAHEFAYVIMEKYFKVSPPVKIHELLSRYAARHITD
jgi:hypothetical protein